MTVYRCACLCCMSMWVFLTTKKINLLACIKVPHMASECTSEHLKSQNFPGGGGGMPLDPLTKEWAYAHSYWPKGPQLHNLPRASWTLLVALLAHNKYTSGRIVATLIKVPYIHGLYAYTTFTFCAHQNVSQPATLHTHILSLHHIV